MTFPVCLLLVEPENGPYQRNHFLFSKRSTAAVSSNIYIEVSSVFIHRQMSRHFRVRMQWLLLDLSIHGYFNKGEVKKDHGHILTLHSWYLLEDLEKCFTGNSICTVLQRNVNFDFFFKSRRFKDRLTMFLFLNSGSFHEEDNNTDSYFLCVMDDMKLFPSFEYRETNGP